MEKYTFSTDFDTVSQNIGVSSERHDKIIEAAKEIAFRAIFTDKTITDKSQAMEMFLNDVKPQSFVEAFWAGFVFSDMLSQTQKLAEQVAKSMQFAEK